MSALVCRGWVVAAVKFGADIRGLRAMCPHDFGDLLAFLTSTSTGSNLTVNQNYMSAYRRRPGAVLACCLRMKLCKLEQSMLANKCANFSTAV